MNILKNIDDRDEIDHMICLYWQPDCSVENKFQRS